MPNAEGLLHLARERQAEMVEFLQGLVRIPSVNGRDAEVAVARRVEAQAAHLGLGAHLVAADERRPNVLVEWGSGPRGFLFVAHIDTVAEGPAQAWAHPPLGAVLDGGRLYGRGAADNKAGLACALYTIVLLRDAGLLDPAAVRVTLAGVVDEESGASSRLGVRYLLDQGLRAAGAIYTYAGDTICIGHRGLLRFTLQARGQAVHTGSPAWSRGEVGANAVTGLAAILLQLEALNLHAPAHPAFPGLGCTVTPGTCFHGGEFESMVPAQAEAMVDVRLLPGQRSQEVLAAARRIVAAEAARRPGLAVEVHVKNDLPGVALAPEHPLVQTARRYARAVTGREWPAEGAGPANEGYMLIEAGIPTLCGFGPQGENAHAPDEWVDLASLPATVAMYAGIVRDYLA